MWFIYWRCGQHLLYVLEMGEKNFTTFLKISYVLLIGGVMIVSQSNGCIFNAQFFSNFRISELCCKSHFLFKTKSY